jgi:hypothetical protein
MPFQLPDDLETIYMQKTGKGHTPSTLKLYKTYLNKLAKEGYDTPALLIANKKKVLDYVKALSDNYRKTAMTSIFYALSNLPNSKKPKIFYNYYQTLKLSDTKLQEYKKAHPDEF